MTVEHERGRFGRGLEPFFEDEMQQEYGGSKDSQEGERVEERLRNGCDAFHLRTSVTCHKCQHRTCVHFHRALESQCKTVFSRLSSHRVAPTSTLRTHSHNGRPELCRPARHRQQMSANCINSDCCPSHRAQQV